MHGIYHVLNPICEQSSFKEQISPSHLQARTLMWHRLAHEKRWAEALATARATGYDHRSARTQVWMFAKKEGLLSLAERCRLYWLSIS